MVVFINQATCTPCVWHDGTRSISIYHEQVFLDSSLLTQKTIVLSATVSLGSMTGKEEQLISYSYHKIQNNSYWRVLTVLFQEALE